MLKYYNKNFFEKFENDNIMLEIKTIFNNNSLKTQIINIEKEYNDKLEFYSKLDVSDFIKKHNSNTSLEILQIELEIIKLISKYILENSKFKYILLKNTLNIILGLSNILRIRINQKDLILEKKQKNISRSSYKFCNFREFCEYNYNCKKNMCYQDHFVHNMVCLDIKILLNSFPKNNEYINQNKDIIKSINTLSFVINHMESELKAKCLYEDKKKWERFHVNRTVKKY
jgi:hypothetical protein